MIFYSEADLVIRIMRDSDIQLFVDAEAEQGVQVSPEDLRLKLKEQDKLKNLILVVRYQGHLAGSITVIPFSQNGPFNGEGYSEIADLKIFDKYKNLGIEDKVIEFAEKISSKYSSTTFLKIPTTQGETINKFLEKGYLSHSSDILDNNQNLSGGPDAKINDDLVVWLYKKSHLTNTHIFAVLTRQTLRWFVDRSTPSVYVYVNFEKCKDINVGDRIVLEDVNSNDFALGKVVFKHKYDSFEDLIKTEGVKNILVFSNNDNFKEDDIEKGVKFYENLAGSYLINKLGCIAFGIKATETNS